MKSPLSWALLGALLFGSIAAYPWGGEGTDDRAIGMVAQLRPDYAPWRAPVFEPSEQVEKWLFVFQAAVGGAVVGWAIAQRRRA
ncbi:MAG: energy-coupling factor ABC transporter substrate-binding protein [Bryobacteraceae bacterium]|nr:energy-coupling factor ABC transporter substrate-binding protein [Bryobacteraceae bacterium]